MNLCRFTADASAHPTSSLLSDEFILTGYHSAVAGGVLARWRP